MTVARINTAIRITPEVHEALTAAAADRGVSMNWLICKAIDEFLPRLIPLDEMRWTRDQP